MKLKLSQSTFVVLVLLLVFFKGILPHTGQTVTSIKSVQAMPRAHILAMTGPAAPRSTRSYKTAGTAEYQAPGASADRIDTEAIKPFMTVLITIVFAGAGLYIILSRKFDEPSKKWAFATIGTIIGFWLG